MSKHPDPQSFDPAAREAASGPVQTLAAEDQPSHRHDGWTPQKQAAFLRALAASHNVSAAARSVGLSRQSAYQLRVRLKGEPFDRAWDAAFHTHFDVLAEKALDRAINGVEVPHFYNGEMVGTSRRYDERLTLALLSMRSHFARPTLPDHNPASAYDNDDLNGLIDRVERGPDHWLESQNAELDAQYGMAVNADEGAGVCPPVSSEPETDSSQ